MFSSSLNPVKAYHQIGVESDVSTADPHKLILLLFDGALSAIAVARQAMLAGDIAKKGNSISKAIEIIESGLRASLDPSQGDLAARLDALYEYMADRLFHANLKNDQAALDEVVSLLNEIRSAWAEIREQVLSGNINTESSAGNAP